MDVIVEGKITSEEPMKDVIETLADLRNFPHLVLRVSASEAELEGRIAFSHGGYILGGRVNNSNESGYAAIQRLLSIKTGNYAILDPGRQQIADINQTLWILSDRVKERLPNLPQTPAGLFDADPVHALEREQSSPGVSDLSFVSDISEFSRSLLKQPEPEVAAKSTIHNIKGKARSFNRGAWYFIQSTLFVLFSLVVIALIIMMSGYRAYLLKPPEKNSIEQIKHPDYGAKTRRTDGRKKSRPGS